MVRLMVEQGLELSRRILKPSASNIDGAQEQA
jgi:hypothetical protein